MKLKLTKAGQELLTKAVNNKEKIIFSMIKLGEGDWTGEEKNIEEAESLDVPFLDAAINKSDVSVNESGDQFIDLSFVFNNFTLNSGHRITEIGVYANNKDGNSILYAIGTEDVSSADYVPNSKERLLEFELQISVYIGDSENVSAIINESMATVSKADFNAHIDDKKNPHKVTKNQVGLGNVPNVKTEDQTPEFSEAAELSNINSREKLSVIMGKIKKAITSLINHLNDKNNPHNLTAKHIKAADEKHNHSANDITKDILPVPRGGSGKDKFDEKSVILGNGKEAFDSVKGTGAFFSFGDAEGPKFGLLPTQFIDGEVNFNNNDEYGCHGSALLPGNLLVQWGRLKVNAGNYNANVYFHKNYKNSNYALFFTTNNSVITDAGMFEGTGTLANWRMPIKHNNGFMLGRENKNHGARYADWIAFGEAAITDN